MTLRPLHPEFFSYRVKRLFMLTAQRLNDVLKPYGLGRSQWQVLARVGRAGTLSQRELQSALRVEPATLTGIVDSLVARGWIERLESDSDKRCRVLRITAEGAALMSGIPDPHEIVERELLDGVSPADRDRAERVLAKMIANLEERA